MQDPFQTLGLPRTFALDTARIERAYLAAISRAHPDLARDAAAAADASDLNEARALLLDSERRANWLLDALGGPSAAELKDLPDGFLMEIMTTRQQVEAALASGDERKRAEWEQWALDQRAWYEQQAAAVLDADPPPSAAARTALRVKLNAWRYIERLIEQLDPAYDPNRADFS